MSFIQINVVGMNTAIRLGIVVAGLVVSTASYRKGQLVLVLILIAVPGKVTRLTMLVAQTIIGSGNRSSGWWCWKPWLPR